MINRKLNSGPCSASAASIGYSAFIVSYTTIAMILVGIFLYLTSVYKIKKPEAHENFAKVTSHFSVQKSDPNKETIDVVLGSTLLTLRSVGITPSTVGDYLEAPISLSTLFKGTDDQLSPFGLELFQGIAQKIKEKRLLVKGQIIIPNQDPTTPAFEQSLQLAFLRMGALQRACLDFGAQNNSCNFAIKTKTGELSGQLELKVTK